ncbi:hypothetical protein HP062_20545 [Pseudomonas sp. B14-6]|uniref:hypothetical protein n=1 Tax=Pseudomonas TaxID=286 RepID=UPI00119827BE|nr:MULTISPECIES: hypothetical protein [Pseudomonas]QKG67787.1 hypothetical protein HP062_20545 [Pseudomonas sp. B14-6]TWS10402.1 hypothetical protein FJD35_11430 [Pseudomonas mandelii]
MLHRTNEVPDRQKIITFSPSGCSSFFVGCFDSRINLWLLSHRYIDAAKGEGDRQGESMRAISGRRGH